MENENDQNVDVVPEYAEESEQEDTTDWKAEALKNAGIAKRYETKLAKLQDKLKSGNPEPKPQSTEANDLDYGKITFLEHRGIKNPEDQKMVQAEADRLKMPLNQIVEMEYMQERLKVSQDQREAMAGMPTGRGKTSGLTKADIDYWLAKGETPDDQELAEKVIEARIKKYETSNKFSDDLYT